jgi:hypothetical protein
MVRVEEPGYETENRVVTFDRDHTLDLSLKKSAGGGTRGPVVVAPPPATPDEPEIKIKRKPPSTQLDKEDPWK